MSREVETLRAVLALAVRDGRAEAARRLAAHAGAELVVVLVRDGELGAMVPAPGLVPTLPGGAAWRDLLLACAVPGTYRAELPLRAGQACEPAIARSEGGAALVFVGPATDPSIVEEGSVALPALGAALCCEQEVVIARGALQAAQEGARDAQALARALDAARTDLESKARLLEEARGRAEEAMRTKDEFLAMLGHELRNPLAPMQTALQLMKLREPGAMVREREILERQVAHLVRLVEDLLDIARITRGQVRLSKRPLEIAQVVGKALEMASPLLEQRGHELEIVVPPQGLTVDGDEARLAQVVSNLLTNAAKYTDPGGHIAVSAACEGEWIVIRVSDDGIGIEPEAQARMFDVFAQELRSGSREQGGLGLGLTIVRTFVRLHDGSVEVRSEGPGHGSEFVVRLPRVENTAASPEPRGESPVAVPSQCRILIVDDNADVAEPLAELLDSFGWSTRVTHDGPSALRAAETFEPEVALLDIGLPVMDGYELAAHLRRVPGLSGLKLVAITGYGQPGDRDRASAAGFDAHLVKPVDGRELADLIVRLTAGG